MSKNYEKVKHYYEAGLWSKARVYAVVGRWITKEEYEEIMQIRQEKIKEKQLKKLEKLCNKE